MALVPVLAVLLLLAPSALPLASVPAPALARAEELLRGSVHLGKTPMEWLTWSEDALQARASLPGPAFGLAAAIRELYAAAGVHATPGQRLALDASAVALDETEAQHLAALVHAAAVGYRAQMALVPLLDVTAPSRHEAALAPALAEANLVNAEAVRAAVDTFIMGMKALPKERAAPFADPLGMVRVGGPGNDVFERNPASAPFRDPVILADLGGDDIDHTSAGGACPLPALPSVFGLGGTLGAQCNGLALSIRIDLAGNDTYSFVSPAGSAVVAQGAGAWGGLGILVDEEGNDQYIVRQTITTNDSPQLYISGSSQGAGEAGYGFLIDRAGNDRYQFDTISHLYDTFTQGQGYAGLGGLGVLLDAAGNDTYSGTAQCDGPRGQFCGVYIQGTTIYPGVGIILDAAGDDDYRGSAVAPQEDYYSQGFAAFGSFALQVDLAGNDVYHASATSTNPNLGESLNCAYGTAFYGGALAIFIDGAGNDQYYDETFDPLYPVATLTSGFSRASSSLFWDVSGNDRYEMKSTGNNMGMGNAFLVAGRGTSHSPLDQVALFLDTGGADTYHDTANGEDVTIGSDGGRWTFGFDVNAL